MISIHRSVAPQINMTLFQPLLFSYLNWGLSDQRLRRIVWSKVQKMELVCKCEGLPKLSITIVSNNFTMPTICSKSLKKN